MKILRLLGASSLVMCALAGCGGGGGGPSTDTPQGTVTVVNGMATKGPFTKDSVVKVYAVTDGQKGAQPLAQTKTTDDNGSYSANLGSYTGPVIVEVSGSYLDEATGRTVPVAETAPIRAALPQAEGTVTLPVTPLTDLAVEEMGGNYSQAAISSANNLVSSIFKVDIIGTVPVVPTSTELEKASDAQRDYTLALAAVSQMASIASGANDTERLKSALTTLSEGITATGISSAAVTSFQGALVSFLDPENLNNKTGINDITGSLKNVGTVPRSYTLSVGGNVAAGLVNGVQFDLTLPEGITVNAGTNLSVLVSSLDIAAGLPENSYITAKRSGQVLSVVFVSATGVGPGAIGTLTCNIPSDTTTPSGSAFALTSVTVVDENGVAISGASVTVN